MNWIIIGIITTAAITIGLVLIQDRSSGVGGAFGGGSEGGVYQTRRGVEKFTFIATIISITAFLGLSILNIYYRGHVVAAAPAPAVETTGVKAVDANGNPVDVKVTPVSPSTTTTTNGTPATLKITPVTPPASTTPAK